MSINLEIVYKDTNENDQYYPIVSTGSKSSYARYWKPIIDEYSMAWVLRVQTAGLPLLEHIDKIDEIRNEFQLLCDTIKSKNDVDSEIKKMLVERITIILQTIDDVISIPDQFEEIYLG